MPKKNKPLPKPPSTPFGRKKSFEEPGSSEPLMADQMAMAMSEGKLDEFLEREMPDNEHARKLAEMMMGMSGMMPTGTVTGKTGGKETKKPSPRKPAKSGKKTGTSPAQPPEELVAAAASGDVNSLVGLLRKEHNQRHGIKEDEAKEPRAKPAPSEDQAAIEKEIIEQLITIASKNGLSLDWIFFRALKRYVQEYEKTGNL